MESLLICVTGAECTGKTTLAQFLAETLAVPLVPEAARHYLTGREGYDRNDVLTIARQQLAAEHAVLADAALAVADTDLTVIQVWWEEKYGALDPWLAEALDERSPRRYVLPCPDLPWEFDPLRESPHDRPRLHARYRELLAQSRFPFTEAAGRGEVRSRNALVAVEAWLAEISSLR